MGRSQPLSAWSVTPESEDELFVLLFAWNKGGTAKANLSSFDGWKVFLFFLALMMILGALMMILGALMMILGALMMILGALIAILGALIKVLGALMIVFEAMMMK